MPEDLKLSQIGSSPLPPPFRGLHSPGVKKKKKSNYLRLLFQEIDYSHLKGSKDREGYNFAKLWFKMECYFPVVAAISFSLPED